MARPHLLTSSLLVLGIALAAPTSALAQTVAGPADPQPSERVDQQRTDDESYVENEEPVVERRRRRRVVIVEEPEAEGYEEESYDESPRERRSKGGGPSAKTVGTALWISGLVVGLSGAAVTLAGSVAEDKPTIITGAVIGLTGSALVISGLIVNMTAGSGGSAANEPTLAVGLGPTSAFVSGTF